MYIYRQKSEDADIRGCLQLPQPPGLLSLTTAGKRVFYFKADERRGGKQVGDKDGAGRDEDDQGDSSC